MYQWQVSYTLFKICLWQCPAKKKIKLLVMYTVRVNLELVIKEIFLTVHAPALGHRVSNMAAFFQLLFL